MDRAHSNAALAVFAAFFIAIMVGIIFSLKILMWPILCGFLFAFILDPAVDSIEAAGFNRTLVISLMFVAFSLALFLFIIFLIPVLHAQIVKLIDEFPAYVQLLKSQAAVIIQSLQELFPKIEWQVMYDDASGNASDYSMNVLKSIPNFFTNIFGIVASAIIVPFVTFFLLKDGAEIKKQIIGIVPNRYFEMALTLFHRVKQQLSKYLRGTILDCSIIAILYVIGYGFIQVRYFVFFAVFAGVCNLIPYMGPWIASVAVIVVMFLDPNPAYPWWSAIVVVAIVQFIENNIIYPIVLGKSINIHPLVIMFGLFVGGEVAGLLGMVISVPVIAVVKVMSEVIYKGLKQYSVI